VCKWSLSFGSRTKTSIYSIVQSNVLNKQPISFTCRQYSKKRNATDYDVASLRSFLLLFSPYYTLTYASTWVCQLQEYLYMSLILLLDLLNVLCLCDTLYFKVEEGKLKRDSINRYWGGNICNHFVFSNFSFRKFKHTILWKECEFFCIRPENLMGKSNL
jgi:hypothetical protein